MADLWSSIHANEGSRQRVVAENHQYHRSQSLSFSTFSFTSCVYVYFGPRKRRENSSYDEDEWYENDHLLVREFLL